MRASKTCAHTLLGTDSIVIGLLLLQSVRGPLPLYRVIMMPSCQSAGTMPDLQTWMNRECKARLTGPRSHFSSSGEYHRNQLHGHSSPF